MAKSLSSDAKWMERKPFFSMVAEYLSRTANKNVVSSSTINLKAKLQRAMILKVVQQFLIAFHVSTMVAGLRLVV